MTIIEQGFLAVDHPHQLYFEWVGNRQGPTVLFIHGGPGIGFASRDKNFFDLEKVNVLFFDQRGCGRSTPLRELQGNTTQDIVKDIGRLLDHLQLGRVYLFGGSWGSTLALLSGLAYPDRIAGMILRGLFTTAPLEREHFEQGVMKMFYPDAWDRFQDNVRPGHEPAVSRTYYRNIVENHQGRREELAYELALYSARLATKKEDMGGLSEKVRKSDYLTRGLILAHYSLNDFFMPGNYLLDRLGQLPNIPIQLIQGRFDMITLPRFSIAVADKFEQFQLTLIDGGHSPHEPQMKKALQAAVEEMVV